MSILDPSTVPMAVGAQEALSPSVNMWADRQEGDPSITLPWWGAWVLDDVLSPMAGEPQDLGRQLELWDPAVGLPSAPHKARQSWYSECWQRASQSSLTLTPYH